jgi:hypothetical protein
MPCFLLVGALGKWSRRPRHKRRPSCFANWTPSLWHTLCTFATRRKRLTGQCGLSFWPHTPTSGTWPDNFWYLCAHLRQNIVIIIIIIEEEEEEERCARAASSRNAPVRLSRVLYLLSSNHITYTSRKKRERERRKRGQNSEKRKTEENVVTDACARPAPPPPRHKQGEGEKMMLGVVFGS